MFLFRAHSRGLGGANLYICLFWSCGASRAGGCDSWGRTITRLTRVPGLSAGFFFFHLCPSNTRISRKWPEMSPFFLRESQVAQNSGDIPGPMNRTSENRTGEPRPLEQTLSWALSWTPSWDVLWEFSWEVLEGVQAGKINPRGCCRLVSGNKWGLSNHFLGPLCTGNFRHKMTTIIGNRGQLWTRSLRPHLLSPHLDLPDRGHTRESTCGPSSGATCGVEVRFRLVCASPICNESCTWSQNLFPGSSRNFRTRSCRLLQYRVYLGSLIPKQIENRGGKTLTIPFEIITFLI